MDYLEKSNTVFWQRVWIRLFTENSIKKENISNIIVKYKLKLFLKKFLEMLISEEAVEKQGYTLEYKYKLVE